MIDGHTSCDCYPFYYYNTGTACKALYLCLFYYGIARIFLHILLFEMAHSIYEKCE